MLQYKLKRFYKNFDELKSDILRIRPDAKVQDNYFKVYVADNDYFEKIIIQHYSDKIEVVR